MLDNMSVEQMSRAVEMVRAHRRSAGTAGPFTEASGGVTERNLVQIAATGVDRISLGALTHFASVLDLAMKIAS